MSHISANKITLGSEVQMHFTIKLTDGSVADSTLISGKPARFKMGDGNITDFVEKSLLGLQAGDKKQITIPPEDGFGKANPNNIYWMPKSAFPQELILEEGLIVGFTQPNGVELPGVIRKMRDDEIQVDFNHPLCGQTLLFDIEIIAVDC